MPVKWVILIFERVIMYKILCNNNQSHFKRKISESLFIRQGLSKFHARFLCKTCPDVENNYFRLAGIF